MLSPSDLEILVEEPAAPARQTDVDPDGWIYDLETGEILGRVGLEERFAVDSVESAEWVLELRSQIEAEVAAIDLRIAAVTAQLKLLRNERVRRLSWWEYRFGPSLIAFARQLLSGGKARTARFGWGSVAFRATSGSNEIVDMAQAVAWMRVWAPEKVKTVETVAVKDVLKVRDLVARQMREAPDELPWLASTGPGESVTISTGIAVETEKGARR